MSKRVATFALLLLLPASGQAWAQGTSCPAMRKINIGVSVAPPNVVHTSPYVAKELGYFAKRCIDATIVQFEGGQSQTSAVAAAQGSAIVSVSDVSIGRGLKVQQIWGLAPRMPQAYMVPGEVKTAADLKGKRLSATGGGVGGFIATRDEERYAHQYPTLNVSLAPTVEGEHGFGIALFEQSCDIRTPGLHLRDSLGRVSFGRGWLKGSVVDLYKENVSRFRPLVGAQLADEDDGIKALDEGRVPTMKGSSASTCTSTLFLTRRPSTSWRASRTISPKGTVSGGFMSRPMRESSNNSPSNLCMRVTASRMRCRSRWNRAVSPFWTSCSKYPRNPEIVMSGARRSWETV